MSTAPRRYPIILLAAAIGSGLHCDQIDEDPNAVLAHLAGPGATACGFASGHREIPSAAEVRACMTDALQSGHAFTASASPASADGSTTIGWASDAKRFWRVEYHVTAGCSPVYHDSLDQEACEHIADRGGTCDSMMADLCFACDDG